MNLAFARTLETVTPQRLTLIYSDPARDGPRTLFLKLTSLDAGSVLS